VISDVVLAALIVAIAPTIMAGIALYQLVRLRIECHTAHRLEKERFATLVRVAQTPPGTPLDPSITGLPSPTRPPS
jgi:hypothetical protein